MPTREIVTHTPGPWTVRLDGRVVVADDLQKKLITDPHDDRRFMADGEAEANARLIAAAPELLAALKLMLVQSGDPNATTGEFDTAAGRAFRAIAKAEGRS